MPTIAQLKEQEITETPLLLFDCALASGSTERWSTHRVTWSGQTYQARVVRHNLFEMRAAGPEGIDSISKVSLTLANADGYFSQITQNAGWKGAKLTVQFIFWDLKTQAAASESLVLFRGAANPPEEITEPALRLSFLNRLGMQRVLLPELRIQRRCAWTFPRTAGERLDAVDGGSRGVFSPFYRCGYSPDAPGGVGSLNAGAPYTNCDYTRGQCEERGMFDADSQSRTTRRFGGIEFVPASVLVRGHGEKGFHASGPVENEARYNDFVPVVYGTAWLEPPVVFARNDGNLTHLEVLAGAGEIQGVVKVVVNDIEIPLGQTGQNMTGTGWYNLVSQGNRTGGFNLDFVDKAGKPVGDPYGSMAYLSVVVPNRISDGRALPRVRVLLDGLKLGRYQTDGSYLGASFTNNPSWVILNLLERSGWTTGEIDTGSFASAAQYCEQTIPAYDLYGNATTVARFQCNLVVRRRRSAADLIRSIRTAAGLQLTYSSSGLLRLSVEGTLALQQPVKPAGSNSTQTLNGGWPAYEFGDGTSGFTGISRRESGEPSLRIWSRSAADTPNRYSVEFQDQFNEYQQDSLSLVDVDDVLSSGQEVSAPLAALGLANFHQAARVIRRELDKSIRGNSYVEFETTVKALGLKPGDLVAVTYLREGYQRKPFRIQKIAPGLNHGTALIAAQAHDDAWYTDTVSGATGSEAGRREPGYEVGLPRPLVGKILDAAGEPQLELSERSEPSTDGTAVVWLSAGFNPPARPQPAGIGIPLLSLSPQISATGGTLIGNQTLYYAISGADANGSEGPLSFVARATIPAGTSTNSVTLANLSFSPGTQSFHVYRGRNPSQLLRIASSAPPAAQFTDTGMAPTLAGPPDENFDHARFYWRLELYPETAATVFSANTIGNSTLQWTANEYAGMVARISQGQGAGQERPILSNTATTLTVSSNWDIAPNATSKFRIAEAAWQLGAAGATSPVEFEIPNRKGAAVEVSGRATNVHGREAAYELSPLTRWVIGGSAGNLLDGEVPEEPGFGILVAGDGTVEVAAVGFGDLDNTRTIEAATFTLHYWDELSSPSAFALSSAAAGTDTDIYLTTAGPAQPGSLIQVDGEVLAVTAVLNGGLRYTVTRGSHGTTAASHAAQAPVYHLDRKVFIIPFPRDFFGSPASGSFSHSVFLPDARIAAGEMFVTNSQGNSMTAKESYTATVDGGLRTLSGGQLTMQVEGYLAIQTGATPPLVIEDGHSVRDIFAVVQEAPTLAPVELRVKQGAQVYANLTIAAGSTQSNTVTGFGLPPLATLARLTLDIVSVGQTATSTPGRDLTVTMRL